MNSPEVSRVGVTVDVLIELDCADLHYSLRDIRGAPGQPVHRPFHEQVPIIEALVLMECQ